MPRNGSGTYSAPTNSWNPAINAVPATSADWQGILNDIVAALTQSLSRDGQTAMTGNQPMAGNKLTGLGAGTASGDSLRFEQLFSQGLQQDVASAATTDIGAQLSTLINVTGTTTITSFGVNYNGPRFLRFADALTLTHSASLVLPGGANITTAAGDAAIVVPLGTPAAGWRVVAYQRAADAPGAAADNSVSTAKIQNDAVTFAKIQNVNTGTVLGRTTAGSGDVEELAISSLTPDASETVKGIVELATTAEVQAGTSNAVAITPLRLREGLNASGSAPIYACRAWVNFNGTGTVAIRASGNVSSVTDNGTGDYTVNFTTAMPDANYAGLAIASADSGGTADTQTVSTTNTAYRFYTRQINASINTYLDTQINSVAIFR